MFGLHIFIVEQYYSTEDFSDTEEFLDMMYTGEGKIRLAFPIRYKKYVDVCLFDQIFAVQLFSTSICLPTLDFVL